VFLEVFASILEVVLGLGRDHATDTIRTLRESCVADTSSRI
jgi:hypothetical protein